MDTEYTTNSNGSTRINQLGATASPQTANVLVSDSESDSSQHQPPLARSGDQATGDDSCNMSGVPRNESAKSLSSLSEQGTSEDVCTFRVFI